MNSMLMCTGRAHENQRQKHRELMVKLQGRPCSTRSSNSVHRRGIAIYVGWVFAEGKVRKPRKLSQTQSTHPNASLPFKEFGRRNARSGREGRRLPPRSRQGHHGAE